MIKDLFERLGFSRTEAEGRPDAPSLWTLKITDYIARPTRIARKDTHD